MASARSVPSPPSVPSPWSAGPAPAPTEAERRASRLAELVAGTDRLARTAGPCTRCASTSAEGDALEVVARAMVDVDAPAPEGFRVAGSYGTMPSSCTDRCADGTGCTPKPTAQKIRSSTPVSPRAEPSTWADRPPSDPERHPIDRGRRPPSA